MFARSDYPKDIRGVVQELNQKRVEMLDKEPSTNQPFSESNLNDEEEYIQPRNDERKPEQGKSIWAAFVDEVGFIFYHHVLACTEGRCSTRRLSVYNRHFFSFPLFLAVQETKRKSIWRKGHE